MTSRFFITINCKHRGHNQLAREGIAQALLNNARDYEQRGRWYLWLIVVMPDHLHLIASFGPDNNVRSVVSQWKRFQSRHLDIEWQPNFFDHRLRNDGEYNEKASYVRMNPVRKALVPTPEAWPFIMDRTSGVLGEPALPQKAADSIPPGRAGSPSTPSSRAGFSILEILCVLLVLSIFYGFIMTAVTALRKGGETRQARTETLALAQALQTYRRVYGRWPGIDSAGTTNDVLVTGEAQTNVVADLLDNPRGLDLIDPPSGVVTNRLYLDPWGNPYLIAMDTSGDGHLLIDRFGIWTVPNVTAGVMSYGGDGTTNTVPIRSWEIHHAR